MTKTMLSLTERYADQLTPENRQHFPPMFFLETEEHRATVHQLRDEAETWLAAQGIDQFTASPASKSALAHDDIDRLFDAGQFLAVPRSAANGGGIPGTIGAVAAVTEPDPDFWTTEEMAEPQAYLSRFLVAEHGKNTGLHLLFALQAAESRRGSRWIRLDCWRTNRKLHEYYLRNGFDRVRTEVVPGRMSGELFQLDLRKRGTSPNDHDWARI